MSEQPTRTREEALAEGRRHDRAQGGGSHDIQTGVALADRLIVYTEYDDGVYLGQSAILRAMTERMEVMEAALLIRKRCHRCPQCRADMDGHENRGEHAQGCEYYRLESSL